MTDQELLIAASKAAGFADIDFLAQDHWANVYDAQGRHSAWNPLTDDGDAFRLASDLHLSVRSSALVNGDRSVMRGHAYAGDIKEAFSGDSAAMYTAARRAIVRAAAEIGKRAE